VKKLLLQAFFLLVLISFDANIYAQNEQFNVRVVNPSYQLNPAWELTWGPNDSLWITENNAYLISKINPAEGAKFKSLK